MSAVREDEADLAMRSQFSRTLGVPALFGSVLAREVNDARRYALFNSCAPDQQARLRDRSLR